MSLHWLGVVLWVSKSCGSVHLCVQIKSQEYIFYKERELICFFHECTLLVTPPFLTKSRSHSRSQRSSKYILLPFIVLLLFIEEIGEESEASRGNHLWCQCIQESQWIEEQKELDQVLLEYVLSLFDLYICVLIYSVYCLFDVYKLVIADWTHQYYCNIIWFMNRDVWIQLFCCFSFYFITEWDEKVNDCWWRWICWEKDQTTWN